MTRGGFTGLRLHTTCIVMLRSERKYSSGGAQRHVLVGEAMLSDVAEAGGGGGSTIVVYNSADESAKGLGRLLVLPRSFVLCMRPAVAVPL